ncbi:MAG: T9SS type A sorting domain-containing protein [Ignavibacteria bacterium]
MRRLSRNISILLTPILLLIISGTVLSQSVRSIIVQFITYNGYGNNLYIDNLTFGRQYESDVSVTSININKDTTFIYGTDTFTVVPQVNVSNLGRSSVSSPFLVIMQIDTLQYISVDTVRSLPIGYNIQVDFDTLRIPANIPVDIHVFTALQNDSNHTNDTLIQKSLFLIGAEKKVLLEEFTSNTSYSCAVNNVFINNFVNAHIASICAVKYHLGFPPPGNDSLYLENPITPNQRAVYYVVNTVPTTYYNGKVRIAMPYSFDSNLTVPLDNELLYGSPIDIKVKDTLLSLDTIRTKIDIKILYKLPSYNYRLKIYAIERFKIYPAPPNINGETQFYDIFRKSITDSSGIAIPTDTGLYSYVFQYYREPIWSSIMTYTTAFVQNETTKEILNCAKSRNIILDNSPQQWDKNSSFQIRYNIENDFLFGTTLPRYELFEGQFPPIGWTLKNPDGWLTFSKVIGFNGISYPGKSCVKVNFYDYNNVGQKDTLISIGYDSLTADDTLKFDYSYAQYLSEYIDSLIVNISTDGGSEFINIFRKGGITLATAQSTTLPFGPISASQWRTFIYPLSGIIPRSNIPHIVPATYQLYQNYPNPFNTRTKIKFEIPYTVFMTLKIYDITGREIKTLLSETKNAGSYIYEFDGANFASGVYFYQLKAVDLILTRKMVLIK